MQMAKQRTALVCLNHKKWNDQTAHTNTHQVLRERSLVPGSFVSFRTCEILFLNRQLLDACLCCWGFLLSSGTRQKVTEGGEGEGRNFEETVCATVRVFSGRYIAGEVLRVCL